VIYKNKKLSFRKIVLVPKDGDEFQECNFLLWKDTEIFKGIKNLKLTDCNLLNSIVPNDAIIVNCLTIKKSMCSHLHPKVTPKCIVECQHMLDKYIIKIDNIQANKSYKYEDKVI